MIDIQTKIGLNKGHPDAYKQAFCILYPRLKAYCSLFINDIELVNDIIQESFITLWDKRNKIKPEKSVESFLFVILRNRCLNELKKEKMTVKHIELNKIKINELQFLYQLDFIQKEEKSIEELLVEAVYEEIHKLPAKMKRAFIECKLEGRKQKDVADEMNISVKMIEKHIAKAKFRIREKIALQHPELFVLIVLLMK